MSKKCLNLSHPNVKVNINELSRKLGLQNVKVSLEDYKAAVRAFSVMKGIQNDDVIDYVNTEEFDRFLDDFFGINQILNVSDDIADDVEVFLEENQEYLNIPLEDTSENRLRANTIHNATEGNAKIINLSDGKFIIRINPFNQKEIEKIKKKAIANGTFMKAPNGKPTNLTERQWLHVRTKAFKRWFGDWENDPKNASKVVDENGEPLVVYHGSSEKNISEFRTSGRGNIENRGVYFTPQKEFAEKYGRNIYEVFLNIKNPLSVDYQGLPWTNIGINKVSSITRLSVQELEETIKPMTDWSLADYITNLISTPTISNDKKHYAVDQLMQIVTKHGYDGLIALNTKDSGKSAWQSLFSQIVDQYVVRNPNQIKSAVDNIGTFSKENDNIYYQKSIITELQKLKTINTPLKARGSIKNMKGALQRAEVSPLIYNTIIKAIETDPNLAKLTPYDLFQLISSSRYKDIEIDYHKSIEEPIIEGLENHLKEFLKRFNISFIDGSELCEEHGVFGAYDILNKVIHLAKNRNAITAPEEAAHAIVELLGARPHKNLDKFPETKDMTFLLSHVENTAIYKRVLEEYSDTYVKEDGTPDILKIKKEAIGQALAVAIKNNWEHTTLGEEKSFWEKLKEFFNKIISAFRDIEYLNFESLLDTIAKEVINNDYSRFEKVDSSKYSILDYGETIAEQNKKDGGKALSFMQWYSNIGNIITGSMSYRKQGSVYRGSLDALHDIDMIVPFETHSIDMNNMGFKALIQQSKDGRDQTALVNYLINTEYFKKIKAKYPKIKFGNAFPTFGYITINAVYSENEELSNKFLRLSGSYAHRLDQFTEEERSQIYLFDFFLKPEGVVTDTIEDSEYGLSLAHWKHSMIEKVFNMGRAKDIFDYQSWKLFEEYKENIPSEKEFLMFQRGKDNKDVKGDEKAYKARFDVAEQAKSKSSKKTPTLKDRVAELENVYKTFKTKVRQGDDFKDSHKYLIIEDGKEEKITLSATTLNEALQKNKKKALEDFTSITSSELIPPHGGIYPQRFIGNGFDAVVRKYFNGGITELDSFDNISSDVKKSLVKQLGQLEKQFDSEFEKGKYKVITGFGEDEFVVGGYVTDTKGNKIAVAGTLDMLVVTESGDVYIYDMKIDSHTKGIPAKNIKKYQGQLTLYKRFIAENFPELADRIKGIRVITADVRFGSYTAEDIQAGISTEFEATKDGKLKHNGKYVEDNPGFINIKINVTKGDNYSLIDLQQSAIIEELDIEPLTWEEEKILESTMSSKDKDPLKELEDIEDKVKEDTKFKGINTYDKFDKDSIKDYSDDVVTLVTPTEIIYLGRQIMKSVSDFLNNLHTDDSLRLNLKKISGKPIYEEKDYFTSMDRDKMLTKKLFNEILEYIKEEYFDFSDMEVTDPDYDKYEWIYNNFTTIVNSAFAELVELEGVSLTSSGEIYKTEDDSNPVPEGDLASRELHETQAYDISNRNTSIIANMNQTVKRELSLIHNYEYDYNGEIITDELGFPVYQITKGFDINNYLNKDYVITTIQKLVYSKRSVSEMIKSLEVAKYDYPWLEQVLSKLRENKDNYQSKFFNTFYKSRTNYIKVYVKEEGYGKNKKITYVHADLIDSAKREAILDGINKKLFATEAEELPPILTKNKNNKAPGLVEVSKEDLKDLESYIDNATGKTRVARETVNAREARKKKAVKKILELLGIEADVNVNMILKSANKDRLNSFLNDVKALKKALDARGLKGEQVIADDITQPYYNISDTLAFFLDDHIEISYYDNGDNWMVFTQPTYIQTLIERLKGAEVTEEIDYEESLGVLSKYNQFVSVSEDGTKVYVSKWLEDIIGSEQCREILNHYVRTSVADKKHFKQTSAEYLTAMLVNYAAPMAKFSKYNVGNQKVAMYRMPIMSDKPAGDEIMFLKYGDVDLTNEENNFNLDYMKEQIADMSFNFFKLEVNRMRAIREQLLEQVTSDVEFYHIPRKKKETSKWVTKDESGNVIPIKFDHKTFIETRNLKRFNGFKFSYCPMFNEEMTNNTKVAQLILDIINSSDESEIAEKFDLLRDSFNDVFISAKEKDYQDFKTNYASQINKDTIIRSIEGIGSEESYDAFLQDFFWNDSFAAMNIYNLTIVDPAFYKDSIDLQKRYAQMHSATSKCNIEAEFDFGRGLERVSDGINRTIFLKDLDIVSELAKEIDELFTQLENEARESENPTKALEYSILKKHLISAYSDPTNVTDGQSYSTLTGFWKKLYMLGQDDPQLTKAITELKGSLEKIENGEFSLENYEMCLQAFKPFVYSLVEHPNDTQALGRYVCPTQIKNSESLLFIGMSVIKGLKKKGYTGSSHILAGLMEVVEGSHWNADGTYNPKGIDTIAFHSAVKNGNYAEINLNDCNTKEMVVGRLKQLLYGIPTDGDIYNQTFVKKISFLDWGKQQEVPGHMQDHEQGEGSQNRIITVADMPDNFELNVGDKKYKTDKKDSAKAKLLKRYFDLISEEMQEGIQSVRKELQLDAKDKASKYKAISKLLVNSVVKDAKYTDEMRKAFIALENGDFVGAVGDPSIADKLFSAIFSLIKKNVNDQKFPGGPVVQVSVYGDTDLGIKYDNPKTKEGMYYELMVTCPTEALEKRITVNTKTINKLMKKAGITSLSRQYIDGELFDVVDAIALGLMKAEEAECIAYRIPTEDKYSILRGRVIKFLPRQLGERVVAPKEITTISGADFDIDKLFCKFKYVIKDLLRKQQDGTLTEKENKILKQRMRRNELFDIQYAVMGHKSSYDKILNPGSFKVLEDLADEVDLTRGGDHSLMDIRGQIYFFEQNGGGKEYVGIGALNNISHHMCNMAELSFAEFPYFQINGKSSFERKGTETTIENYRFDTTYSLFDGSRISRTLGMFVGAAADNAKKAVLASLNIIPTTATLANGLLRMGIPLQTVVYILNHPDVKAATKEALIQNKPSAFNSAIRYSIRTIVEKHSEYAEFDKRTELVSKTNFTDNKLKERIFNDSILKSDPLFDLRILSFLEQMIPYCQAISDVSTITSLNSTKNAVGPRAFDTIKRQIKIKKLFKDVKFGNSVISDSLLNIYDKLSFLRNLESCFSELVPEIFSDLSPIYAKDFLDMLEVLSGHGLDIEYMEDNDFAKLLDSWLLFKASSEEKKIIDASYDNRKKMIYDFPLSLIQAQRSGTLNNEFIKSLNTPTQMNKSNKIVNVTFSSIGKSRELRADLAASWEELASSKNSNNVELSNNLLTYMMFRFGWSFSPKSAMNIAPNKAKSAFKDYKNMFSGNDEINPVAIHEFLIQYARNNWYSKIWVNPGLTSEEGSFVTKGGIKYFILTDPEVVENLHFLRMGKSRYVRIKEGVYMQVEKLGIAKNFLEYNGSASNSAFMKSVVTNASTSEQTKQYKGLQVQDTVENLDSEIEDDGEEVFTEKKITTSITDLLNSFSADVPEYIQDAEFKKLLNSQKILKNIREKGFKNSFNQAVEANNKKAVWDMLQKIATSMKESFTEKEIEKSYKNIQKKFEEDNLC